MSLETYAGFGRLLAEDLAAFAADAVALQGLDGAVFLDPEDGLNPIFLAERLWKTWPRAKVVLPLVGRDRNRTALLSAARTARAAGASGLLLLSGRLDPASRARTVYDLDPLQLLGFLREQGIDLPCWVSSRCATAAEQARVASLAAAGAARCLLPWTAEEPGASCAPLRPLFSVAEADWAAGRLPKGDLVLHVAPGRGVAAAGAVAVEGLS